MAFNVEELFDSIKVIVTQELNDQSFDSTVICTIVEDTHKESGHYVVSDGTIKFDAYTNDSSYEKGKQVRVSIPNGDYSQRKFIVGPYVADMSGAPVTYISPIGTTVSTTQNLLENNIGDSVGGTNLQSFSIKTNAPIKNKVLWKASIAENSKYYDLQANNIYNIITLSANFETNLGDLLQGNYGLRLDLLFTPEKGSNERIQKFVTFDSSEMMGNPYSFVIPTPQQKQINIGVTGIVTEMVLSIYQGIITDEYGRETNNPFIDLDNQTLPLTDIKVKGLHLGFASDLTSIENNTLQIYTNDPLGYVYNGGFGDTDTNKKHMGLLWYNKTEDNEYIGFSDGLAGKVDFDSTGTEDDIYDEIKYREISSNNSRLMAQLEKGTVPTDYYGLMLAADIEEATPIMTNVYNSLTPTLSSLIQELGRNLSGSDFLKGLSRSGTQAGIIPLNKFTASWQEGNQKKDALLIEHKKNAINNLNSLTTAYNKILSYAYTKQMTDEEVSWPDSTYTTSQLNNYYNNYISAIETALLQVEQLLLNIEYHTRPQEWKYTTTLETEANNKNYALIQSLFLANDIVFVYPGYRGIYDSFNKRINLQIQLIRTELSKVKRILEQNITPKNGVSRSHTEALMAYKNSNYSYVEYREADLSNFNNRYCIYWYEYDTNYMLEYDPDSADNKEYLYGNFAGLHWKRIKEIDSNGNETDTYKNIGLPTATFMKEVDGVEKEFYIAKSEEETVLTYDMDPKTKEERIKAILFYNHNQYESNVLTFINLEAESIPDEDLADASDVLRIEHDQHSFEHYASYNSAHELVDISDGPMLRQIKCFYDGVFSGDETLVDAGLYWYIPTSSTMLTYDKAALIAAGYSTDADKPTQYSRDGYVYFYKKVGSVEKDEPVLDSNGNPTYNEGEPVVTKITTSKMEDRYFTYKIKSFYEESAKNNTIEVHAHVPSGDSTLIVKGSISFAFSISGTNGTKYTLAIGPSTSQIPVTHTDALDLKVTLRDASNNPLKIYKADSSETEQFGKNTKCEWIFPNKNTQNYLSEAEAPDKDYFMITVNKNQTTLVEPLSNCGGILSVTTILNQSVTNNLTQLQALYAVPYSINAQYYIAGPTIIVYNNAGNVSRLSEDPYCLYQHNLIENETIPADSIVAGEDNAWTQSWTLEYYEIGNNSIRKLDKTKSDDLKIISYLPSLNNDKTLVAPAMYFTDVNERYFTVAVCRKSTDNTILWAQPIIITQNNFASATLNNWDGKLAIDEANGTIMSTMIGAGKKNTDNSFSGVLMGDVSTGAGSDVGGVPTTLLSTKTGLGIYGFHNGAQSFNFNIDGTAFLGKAGRGRLSFDGNNGILYSGNWLSSFGSTVSDQARAFIYDPNTGDLSLAAGTAGMALDLQNGHIDAYNFKVTSNNIYLNSTPPDGGYYFRIGNNGGTTPIDIAHTDNDDNGVPLMTKGYMSFDKEGKLDIRTNALSITGQLGGVNLLRQTSPKRLMPLMEMKKTITKDNDDNKSYSYNIVPLTINNNPQYDWDVAQRNTYTDYLNYCALKGYVEIQYESSADFNADNKRTKYRDSNGRQPTTSWVSSSTKYYVAAMTPLDENSWNALTTLAWNTPNVNTLLAGSYPNDDYAEAADHLDKKYYLTVIGGQKKVSQTITGVKTEEYYTLSGQVSGLDTDNEQTLTISFYNNGTEIPLKTETRDGIFIPQWSQKNEAKYTDTKWTPFEITFKTPETAIDSLTITFTGTSNFALWHLKLEYGSIATAWSPAPDDVEDTILAEQEKYNTYLSQDVIFDKLITDDNGQKMVGIWLLPGEDSASGHNELYMNATYISTGILRSNNWDGVLETKNVVVDGQNRLSYDLKTAPTEGMYLNLNEGKIWAANFELTAGDTLYLNSNPSAGKNWFRVGTSTNYLKFTKDSNSASSLTLNMTGNFTLNAGKFDDDDFLGLYSADQSSTTTIHGEALKTWRIIAGKKFGVTKDGSVHAANVNIEGTINSEDGEIGGWTITATTLQNGTVTLDAANSKISGGTLWGSTILGGSLDIGGSATGSGTGTGKGTGAFSVDNNGNIHIGTKAAGATNYPFEVTNAGSLYASEGTIGGWKVTKTEIKHNSTGGICLNSTNGGGISSSNWNSLPNGTTEFKDLQVANTFKVKKALGTKPGDAGDDVLVVTSGGDLKFEGNIYLGSGFKYVGYGGSGTGTVSTPTAAIADGSGFKTVKIDTPWDNSKGFMTFYNGILVGFRTEASTWEDFVGWLFGKETVDQVTVIKTIGSVTRPVYVNKGAIEPIDRATSGHVYMGRGALNDHAFIDITGYTDSSQPNRFGLTYSGHGDAATNNKFYVTVPVFSTGNASAAGKPGLVPAPAAGDTSGKFLQCNGNWTALTSETKAADGYVLAGNGTGALNGKPSFQSLGSLLGATAANSGQVLASNGANTLTWKSFPTLVSLLPAMAEKAGKVLKVNSTATGVYWGDDNNSTNFAAVNHTHSGYLSTTGTAAAANKVNCSSTTSYSTYRVVGTTYSSGANTLVYASAIYMDDINSSSSLRFKNSVNILTSNTSNILYQLQPVSFYYKPEFGGTNLRYGFIAEDVYKIAPELVAMDPENPELCRALYNNSILALAVAEIQKLRKELDELKSNLNKE